MENALEYDAIASGVFAPLYPVVAEAILERTGVLSGRMLDVGCGGGQDLASLQPRRAAWFGRRVRRPPHRLQAIVVGTDGVGQRAVHDVAGRPAPEGGRQDRGGAAEGAGEHWVLKGRFSDTPDETMARGKILPGPFLHRFPLRLPGARRLCSSSVFYDIV